MYHVAVDNQIPYYFYTNMQDDTTMRGPSVQVGFGGFGRAAEPGWDRGMGGCESGFTYRRSDRSEHCLGHLLWRRSDALGCAELSSRGR